MDLSPDGRFLVLLARTGVARVWDTDAGQPVSPTLDAGGEDAFAVFSPDGRRLLTGGPSRVVRVHDLSPDLRPAADLADHARLLANRRLDDRGVLVPLTRAGEGWGHGWRSGPSRTAGGPPPGSWSTSSP